MAAVMAGMIAARAAPAAQPAAAGDGDRPLIAASMFGVTTPAVETARTRLAELGYEVLVFHATGAGGRALEALAEAGSGPAFPYDITRQLCIAIDDDSLINSDDDDDGEDEDDLGEGIWQLQLTVYFRPDEENARLGHGERWLERPDGIGEFARWIAGLPATAYCAGRRPSRTELVWDQV